MTTAEIWHQSNGIECVIVESNEMGGHLWKGSEEIMFDLQAKTQEHSIQCRRVPCVLACNEEVYLVLLQIRNWPLRGAEGGWSEVGDVQRGRTWRMLKTLSSYKWSRIVRPDGSY